MEFTTRKQAREAAKRAIAKATTEKEFMGQVIVLARSKKWRVYHTWNSRHSEPGYPDLTLVRLSRLVFIECKSEDGSVNPPQTAWLAALEATGKCEVYVLRPSQWAEAEAILE